MLGQALLAEARARGMDVSGAGRSGPDVHVDVREQDALEDTLAQARPDLVVNSVALVDLGQCESMPDVAYAVNARSVAFLAESCRRHAARLVQVSTDHYYVGDGAAKHDESAPLALVNEYARTKFAGEAFALTRPDSLVIRTNVTGFRGRPGKPTFLEWAIAAIESGEQLTMFDDFYTSTMAAGDCAVALFDLAEREATGLFNVACAEVSNKRAFLETLAGALGCPLHDPIAGSVRSLLPRRAESLGLDVSRAESALGRRLPGLRRTIDKLVAARRVAAAG
jgi:dTDP-4-dehydrorhamnose reductase